jgi:hypothetical protein
MFDVNIPIYTKMFTWKRSNDAHASTETPLRCGYIREAHQCAAAATCARILEGGILRDFLLVMFSNPPSLVGGEIGFLFCNRIFKIGSNQSRDAMRTRFRPNLCASARACLRAIRSIAIRIALDLPVPSGEIPRNIVIPD